VINGPSDSRLNALSNLGKLQPSDPAYFLRCRAPEINLYLKKN
jgi:hypothetical protein